LVSSKFHFKYGRLDVEAILPKGKGLWPAIWTTAYDSWPPEIDIVEGYSEDRDNYGNLVIPGIRLQSNVHYKEGENNRNIGGRNHWMWKNPTKHKIKYSLLWTPEKIEIFYNDCKVRSVDDPKILEGFNNSAGQYIVLNNAIQPEKWDGGTSEFIVSSLMLETERLIW
jgi:beta-glucanase (GH16 family)